MWNQTDKENWFKKQSIKRSYQKEVVSKILELKTAYDVTQYGAVKVGVTEYPVFLVKSKTFNPALKTVLITGGVHGYETSGVHGALEFMKSAAGAYADKFNFVCAPCISPWSYETINRWNAKAMDPNRSFKEGTEAEECSLFMNALAPYQSEIEVHFDLHETTDTDNTIFRLALAERDGKEEEFSEIPDGFYTVGPAESPCPEFQKAIIDSVRKVTHIAQPDKDGKLIGAPIEQEGVVHYSVKSLGLCGGLTTAKYSTTTEVYPDSPKVTDAICVRAQVAAVRGGLDYLI